MTNNTSRKIAVIRSGGQTGVDRGALDAARAAQFPITGYVPQDGWAEDLTEAPGLLAPYPELIEMKNGDVIDRTIANVLAADATLIIIPSHDWESPGTRLTIETAEKADKPLFIALPEETKEIKAWLETLPNALDLNIAGPRESFAPGIAQKTQATIATLLRFSIKSGVNLHASPPKFRSDF